MTIYFPNKIENIVHNGQKINKHSFLYSYGLEYLKGRLTDDEFYTTLNKFPAKISQEVVDAYLDYIRNNEAIVR